jgi:ferredoxin-thioredoxin reductase catalytic subunit
MLIFGLIFNIQRIGIQTFFCQLLKDSSEEVSDAIYDCGWESFEDEKCKNFVKFSLMKAQRLESFRILDWMEINLELFGKVRKFL